VPVAAVVAVCLHLLLVVPAVAVSAASVWLPLLLLLPCCPPPHCSASHIVSCRVRPDTARAVLHGNCRRCWQGCTRGWPDSAGANAHGACRWPQVQRWSWRRVVSVAVEARCIHAHTTAVAARWAALHGCNTHRCWPPMHARMVGAHHVHVDYTPAPTGRGNRVADYASTVQAQLRPPTAPPVAPRATSWGALVLCEP
jgi:hypothetical protein